MDMVVTGVVCVGVCTEVSCCAEQGLIRRMKRLDFEEVTFEQVLLVHGEEMWDKVQATERKSYFLFPIRYN